MRTTAVRVTVLAGALLALGAAAACVETKRSEKMTTFGTTKPPPAIPGYDPKDKRDDGKGWW